jgi:hypothetical protein
MRVTTNWRVVVVVAATLTGCGTSYSTLPVADVLLKFPSERRTEVREIVKRFSTDRGYKYFEESRNNPELPPSMLLVGRESTKLDISITTDGVGRLRATIHCWDKEANWRNEVALFRSKFDSPFPGISTVEKERPEFCQTPKEYSWSLWR